MLPSLPAPLPRSLHIACSLHSGFIRRVGCARAVFVCCVKMEKEIKPEELIPLVHERAVLWDKTLNDYKNNNLKLLAWREICTILIPNFENMEEKERQHFGKCQ